MNVNFCDPALKHISSCFVADRRAAASGTDNIRQIGRGLGVNQKSVTGRRL